MKKRYLALFSLFVFIHLTVFSKNLPLNFIFLGGDSPAQFNDLLHTDKIDGVQRIYTWKSLEIHKNIYDFSEIEKDLKYLNSVHKKLFIQIQDRFFALDARNIPDYLLEEPQYCGGLVAQTDHPGENLTDISGWVSIQWNIHLRRRFQKLIFALAKKFDGQIYGISLPETSIDIDLEKDKTGFTCDKYFNSEIENMLFTKTVFKQSIVLQYVNFFPCEWDNDHGYMGKFFQSALKNQIGLGGPDTLPYQKSQMHNSYPFFEKFKASLKFIGMAVQEPDLTYINSNTQKPFTKVEFEDFASNYLGATVIFWNPQLL